MPKKVSPQTLDAIVEQTLRKDGNKESMSFGSIAIEFTVKRYLSIPERSAFVDRAVAGCFSNDVFIPEYIEVFKEIAFYQVFTNLPVPSQESDSKEFGSQLDIQRIFDFCKALNLVQEMTKKYPEIKVIYESLCECVDKQIEFKKAKILSQEHYVLSKTAEQMEAVSEQIGELFDGFNGKDLSAAMNVVAGLDKGAIIDALTQRAASVE